MNTPDFWSVLGTWVSGLATLFVGVVALYTARPKLKPSLKISCGLMVGYGSLEGQEMIVINVANTAVYPIIISVLAWQFPTSKLLGWQQLSNTNYSNKLPDNIQPGMQSTYLIDWNILKKQIPELLNKFEISKVKHLEKMQIVLSTSLGEVRSAVQPSLYEEISKFLEAPHRSSDDK